MRVEGTIVESGNAAGSSAPACSDFDRGVWFRSSCSGLWYRCKESAGDIDAWKEDGVLHEIEEPVAWREIAEGKAGEGAKE